MKNNYLRSVGLGVLAAAFCFPAESQTTFNYTGAMQTYVVPPGVTSVQIDVIAASGGYTYSSGPVLTGSGDGGRVEATLTVTPGSTLNIYVGGQGESPTGPIYAAGGFNGGGVGGTAFGAYAGGGGGGASDIRVGGTALTDRIVVAGGGGGSSFDCGGGGDGHGGGLTAVPGNWTCGGVVSQSGLPGTPSAGGAGGTYGGYASGMAGALGIGGAGGVDGASGGGGGGYYGGGGGAWAGGGGGSSYTDAVLATGVTHTQGYNEGNGMIVITELCTGLTTSVSATDVCEGDMVPFRPVQQRVAQ